MEGSKRLRDNQVERWAVGGTLRENATGVVRGEYQTNKSVTEKVARLKKVQAKDRQEDMRL
jgi:hypothetical protein